MTEHATQQEFRWEAASLRAHLVRCGVRGLLGELLVLALESAEIVRRDGVQCGLLRGGERKLAAALGGSKSGVREALQAGASRCLLSRGDGLTLIDWEAVRALEPVDVLESIPMPAASAGGRADAAPPERWSGGGRSVVGPSLLLEENTLTRSLAHARSDCTELGLTPPTTDRPGATGALTQPRSPELTTDRPGATGALTQPRSPERATGLGYRLSWSDLWTRDRRPNRSGITRLFRAALGAGWVSHRDDFRDVLALCLVTADREAVAAAGIASPVGWLVGVLRAGRYAWEGVVSAKHYASADEILGRVALTDQELGFVAADETPVQESRNRVCVTADPVTAEVVA